MRKIEFCPILIPVKDINNIAIYTSQTTAACYVYYLDGKAHGKIPAIVLPDCADIWGGKDYIKSKGYSEHWIIFQHPETGVCTFGNRYSFEHSTDPAEQEAARNMIEISIDELKIA